MHLVSNAFFIVLCKKENSRGPISSDAGECKGMEGHWTEDSLSLTNSFFSDLYHQELEAKAKTVLSLFL